LRAARRGAVIAGATSRTKGRLGAAGSVRRPTKGSIRCDRADGNIGAFGKVTRDEEPAGLTTTKSLAGGCGCVGAIGLNSAIRPTVFGEARSGRLVGKWNGEIFFALR